MMVAIGQQFRLNKPLTYREPGALRGLIFRAASCASTCFHGRAWSPNIRRPSDCCSFIRPENGGWAGPCGRGDRRGLEHVVA